MVADDAGVGAVFLVVDVLTGKRPLCPFIEAHFSLRRSQRLLTLFLFLWVHTFAGKIFLIIIVPFYEKNVITPCGVCSCGGGMF